MICNPEDIVRIVADVIALMSKREDERDIAFEETVRKIIGKMDAEGYFNHDHKDGEQEPYNEER